MFDNYAYNLVYYATKATKLWIFIAYGNL